jgi:phenylacetate-CoA ligase
MYGALRRNAAAYSVFLSVTNRLPTRLVYREPYFAIRTLLQQAESGEDIAHSLAARLAGVLQTAITRVPYYRSLELGIRPDEIEPGNAHEVLMRFPYLEKGTVMRAPESFVSNAHRLRNLTSGTTGGSTGQGMKMWRNVTVISAEASFHHHRWAKVGYVRSARVVRMAQEGGQPIDAKPCARSGDRLLVSPWHFNERWIGRIFEDIRAFQPQFFHTYPSCFEYLADYMNKSGLRLEGISGIFLASERVTERLLNLIGTVFEDVPVVFHYGLGERTNLAWGSWRNGEITYELERVYGHSENYAVPGFGLEVVGTSYWNNVMPLIRYRTQDYGEIRDGVLRHLEGREQEFLVTKSGTKMPGLCIDIDDYTFDYVEVFQVVQNQKGRLEFHLKPRAEYTEAIGQRILASQRSRLGDNFDLSVVVTDHIERTSSGKIRRYVINVPEDS